MNRESYELPQSLRDKLRGFETRLKRMETVITICGTGVGFVLAWLFLYISDRIWDTPTWVRLGIAVAGMTALAAFINLWLRRWLYRRRNLRDLAKLIQKEYRDLGDRLLGIVELAEGNHPEEMSPALVRAAIRQVAGQSEDLDFRNAARSEKPRGYAATFAFSLILFGSLLAFNPTAGINTFLRLINPITPPGRYTFVSLKDLPDELTVCHGEGFTVNVGIRDDSFKTPDKAKASIGQLREPINVDVCDGWARFKIPPQIEDSVLRIRVWDALHEIRILPKRRPAIKGITAFVTYPTYLKKSYPPRQIEGITFSALKESRITLAADLQRKMKSVRVTVNGVNQSDSVTMTATGFSLATLILDKPLDLEMSWTDHFGIAALKAHKLRLLPMNDTAPVVELPRQALFEALLIDESKEIAMHADDDHGLRDLTVEWFASDQDGNRMNMQAMRQVVAPGSPEKTNLQGKFIFSAELMGVPAQSIVTLYGTINDYFPKRDAVSSPAYKFYILSHAEHAKLIQDEFEKLQIRLEGVIRDQAGIKKKTDALNDKLANELQNDGVSDTIKDLEMKQAANRKGMETLAQKGIKLLQEAMRNKEIPPSHLREWTQMLQNMQAISGQNMQQAGNKLDSARQSTKGEPRKNDLKKASDEMAAAIKKMQKLLKNFNKAMENLAAQNFIQRLKGLARNEGLIRSQTQGILGETIGTTVNELTPATQKKLTRISRIARAVEKESDTLLTDLDGFFTRTRTAKYETVVKQMRKAELLDALNKHTKAIEQNRGMTVIQMAINWENSFKKWATLLGGGDDRKSPGQGQGQEMTAEQMELLLKLLRVVQQEYNILMKTRRLDKVKDYDESYEPACKRLAKLQKELKTTVDELLTKVPPKVKPLLDNAGKAMNDAAALLNVPDTGKPTRAAELEVIELLTKSCTSCSQAMGCTPGLLGMLMQQMMRSMGMGEGQMGGGSLAGGGRNDGSTQPGGKASHDELDTRAKKTTAGRSLDHVPPEFREALKAYYNRLQEIGDL